MKTARLALNRLGLPLLALFLIAPPASAQQAERGERDEGGKQTIVIEIEDGNRTVTVNGEKLNDEEAEAYLDEWLGDEGNVRVFRAGPLRERLRGFDAADEVFARVRGLDHPRTFIGAEGLEDLDFMGEGADFTFRLGESMKERSEIAKMDLESRRLAREVRQAEGAERDRLEQELKDKLNEIFDRKQALRDQEAERLRDRLDEVNREQQERVQARDEIVERRMKKLLGQDDKYDW